MPGNVRTVWVFIEVSKTMINFPDRGVHITRVQVMYYTYNILKIGNADS